MCIFLCIHEFNIYNLQFNRNEIGYRAIFPFNYSTTILYNIWICFSFYLVDFHKIGFFLVYFRNFFLTRKWINDFIAFIFVFESILFVKLVEYVHMLSRYTNNEPNKKKSFPFIVLENRSLNKQFGFRFG